MGVLYHIEPTVTPEPDIPVVFVIDIEVVGDVLANSAQAVWSTNKLATSVFRYGLDPDYLTIEVPKRTPALINSTILSNLIMEQIYYYEIVATAFTGEVVTVVGSFTTTKEVTIESHNLTNAFTFIHRVRQVYNFELIPLWETEIVNTVEPDGDDALDVTVDSSVHAKVELAFTNSTTTTVVEVAVN